MSTVDIVLCATNLGKRYRRGWALNECTFELPAGRIAALVGPNGAGKSTLMKLAAGLIRPSEGSIEVFGAQPESAGAHRRLAYLAQHKPLYRGFTVAEMLRAGRRLNPRWDDRYAERLVDGAGVPQQARIGSLSGGQRTRVALALALGRRPDLVMLDEPLADLDPLARQEFMQALMAEVADTGMSVILSSHVLSELDGICDHLVLVANGRVRVAGDIADLLSQHQLMIGPAGDALPFPRDRVVEARTTGRQATVLVRTPWSTGVTGWERHDPSLEEVALAYLRSARTSTVPAGALMEVAA